MSVLLYASIAALAFVLALLFAEFFDWLDAPIDCTCRRHAWDPACPVHGRQA